MLFSSVARTIDFFELAHPFTTSPAPHHGSTTASVGQPRPESPKIRRSHCPSRVLLYPKACDGMENCPESYRGWVAWGERRQSFAFAGSPDVEDRNTR